MLCTDEGRRVLDNLLVFDGREGKTMPMGTLARIAQLLAEHPDLDPSLPYDVRVTFTPTKGMMQRVTKSVTAAARQLHEAKFHFRLIEDIQAQLDCQKRLLGRTFRPEDLEIREEQVLRLIAGGELYYNRPTILAAPKQPAWNRMHLDQRDATIWDWIARIARKCGVQIVLEHEMRWQEICAPVGKPLYKVFREYSGMNSEEGMRRVYAALLGHTLLRHWDRPLAVFHSNLQFAGHFVAELDAGPVLTTWAEARPLLNVLLRRGRLANLPALLLEMLMSKAEGAWSYPNMTIPVEALFPDGMLLTVKNEVKQIRIGRCAILGEAEGLTLVTHA